MSARRSRSSRRGKLAVKLALVTGAAALLGGLLALALVVPDFADRLGETGGPAVKRAWMLGGLIVALTAGVVAVLAYTLGQGVARRVTDLGLAVNKLGRGATETRVRVAGSDEVTALGQALQFLATDLASLEESRGEDGGQLATMDPQVRALRDAAIRDDFPDLDGFEIDGTFVPGSRGGLDTFGAVGSGKDGSTDRVTLFMVSAEGQNALSVVALFLARDELERALTQGANARRALAHTNKVMHRKLPRGACAKATLVELESGANEAKLYMAGARIPLQVCSRGERTELEAEGLALGLDDGPVFEKSLRSTKIPLAAGTRLSLINEAGARNGEFLDLLREHSPKHTSPFLNLVLGAVEADADEGGGLREDHVLLSTKRF